MGYCTTAPGNGSYPPALEPWALLPANQTMTRAWCQSKPTVTTSAYHAQLNLSFPSPVTLSNATWFNPILNYDNVPQAMLKLVAIMPLPSAAMLQAINANGVDEQPTYLAHPEVSLFFLLVNLGLFYFVFRLFSVLMVLQVGRCCRVWCMCSMGWQCVGAHAAWCRRWAGTAGQLCGMWFCTQRWIVLRVSTPTRYAPGHVRAGDSSMKHVRLYAAAAAAVRVMHH
jgi:hypothetical protein